MFLVALVEPVNGFAVAFVAAEYALLGEFSLELLPPELLPEPPPLVAALSA